MPTGRVTLRFRFDSNHQPESVDSPLPKPGTTPLNHLQRVEFLKLIHEGMGRTVACAQLGIGSRVLSQALAESPGFRKAVEQLERVRAEKLYLVLYKAALQGDIDAARFLLTRHDRVRENQVKRRGLSS